MAVAIKTYTKVPADVVRSGISGGIEHIVTDTAPDNGKVDLMVDMSTTPRAGRAVDSGPVRNGRKAGVSVWIQGTMAVLASRRDSSDDAN